MTDPNKSLNVGFGGVLHLETNYETPQHLLSQAQDASPLRCSIRTYLDSQPSIRVKRSFNETSGRPEKEDL